MIQHTTGGTFDTAQPFKAFLAAPYKEIPMTHQNLLVAVNDCKGKKGREFLDRLVTNHHVLLDSGVFNLAMNHVRAHHVPWEEAVALPPDQLDGFNQLWDEYADIATTYADALWGIVELDLGGAANKKVTRARIESELGIIPMPVYHPLIDPYDYFDELATGYDRICLANIAQTTGLVRTRLLHTAWERARDYPDLWVHVLGLSPSALMLSLPFHGSADASTWLNALRWPGSWKASAMFETVGHYPPPMWSHRGSQTKEDYNRPRAVAILDHTAITVDATIDHHREHQP